MWELQVQEHLHILLNFQRLIHSIRLSCFHLDHFPEQHCPQPKQHSRQPEQHSPQPEKHSPQPEQNSPQPPQALLPPQSRSLNK